MASVTNQVSAQDISASFYSDQGIVRSLKKNQKSGTSKAVTELSVQRMRLLFWVPGWPADTL
jgi:hypothetical protein